jgi:hypothetical protein
MEGGDYVLALDVEASGQGIRTNFMTAIGAALVNGKTLEKVAGFQSYLAQPEDTCWEQRCVDEFWSKFPDVWEETKKRVASAEQPEVVMDRFRHWVLEVTKGKKVKIVFDTSGFDQAWIDYYLGNISCLYLMGYYDQPMDISSYMRGVGKAGFDISGKKSFVKAMQLDKFPEWEEKHDHNPENDATCIAKNACFVMRELQLI